MKHNYQFFLSLLLFCSLIGLRSNLWVGYACEDTPRTPGIQGKIDKNYIAQFLPTNPIIVEAGAHNGTDTVQMATMWPTSTIYSFEPVPTLFNALASSVRRFKNIHIFKAALGPVTKKGQLFVSDGNSDGASSSLLKPTGHLDFHPDITFTKKIVVDCFNLDDWATLNNIDHIDMMWLDMQGMEYKVLKAAPHILKGVKVIYTEVSLKENYKDGELYPIYKQFLEENGFTVVREDLPYLDGGNVLFVKL